MITLGVEVQHTITGFKGVATARVEYLNGCIQYCVQPQGLDKDGKIFATEYIDDRALVEIGPGITVNTRPSDGGPQSNTPGAKPAGLR